MLYSDFVKIDGFIDFKKLMEFCESNDKMVVGNLGNTIVEMAGYLLDTRNVCGIEIKQLPDDISVSFYYENDGWIVKELYLHSRLVEIHNHITSTNYIIHCYLRADHWENHFTN